MNIQSYANIYASFKSSFPIEADQFKVVLSFAELPCDNRHILRLTDFDKIITKNIPFLNALKTFYNSEAISSVFLDKRKLSILIGNERIIYPTGTLSNCNLCATPFFIKDPSVFENYLKGQGRLIYENVYSFKNSIIYLDEYDIPSPGKIYFEENEPNSLYRICFLTRNIDELDLYVWKNRKEVYYIPFKTKNTSSLPHFIHYNPVDELMIPDTHAKSTGTIQKNFCKKNPKYLLQDILNSYLGSLDYLGILIEYPFCIGYDGTCEPTNKFVALSVNGNFPKKVIQIKKPYDRYIEYDYVPATRWSQIYYEKQVSYPLDRVIIRSTTIGFIYKDVFLCLNHPMLSNLFYYTDLNTNYLCKFIVDFDITKESNINVLDTYKFDCNYTLHRIKHKDIPYELWCMSKNKESSLFPKRTNPPHLVDHWSSFFARHCKNQELDFTNLNVVKLAFVLSKHKICFKISVSPRPRELHLDKDGLIFRLDEAAVEFLNTIRLNIYEKEILFQNEKNSDQSSCNIM